METKDGEVGFLPHFICSAPPPLPFHPSSGVLGRMNGPVCPPGDQTWHSTVYLRHDENLKEPKTLVDEMDRERVKCPALSALC